MKTLSSIELMPKPFDWIEIPAGKVTLGGSIGGDGGYITQATTFELDTFSIAKYALTNSQFATFIDAGGYQQTKWWTKDGWQRREKEIWEEPL